MRVCTTIADVRAALEPRRDGTVGLVPTMGALHEGHRSLLRAARAECETVVLEQGNLLVSSFHPELIGETGLHRYLLAKL